MLRFVGTWFAVLVAAWVLLSLFSLFFGDAAFWLLAVTAVAVLFALFGMLSRENDELRKRVERLEAQLPDTAQPPAEEAVEAVPAAED